jgi:mono/diheme cytochrome c family protein
MRTALLLVFASLLAQAQDAAVTRGAKVFAQSCAVGYCHGSGGAANRGPRIAGRGFDRAFVEKVIRDGVPGTAMPGFKASLKAEDLEGVIAYVMNISGGGSTGALPAFEPLPNAPKFSGPPEAKRGKDLFFDPVRGTRCGTCHAMEDWGIAIGPNLAAKPPATASAIRGAKATSVRTATAGAERFPALLVARRSGTVQVYDLGVTPPVLRTFADNEVRLDAPSNWSHGEAIRSYTDAELGAVAAYLKWLASR